MTASKILTLPAAFLVFFLSPLRMPGSAIAEKDYFQQAVQAKERGDLAQAVSLLKQDLLRAPSHADARLELARTLFELKRWKESEDEFKRFLQLRPDSYEAHNRLATIYARLGMSDSLARELKTVTRLKPEMAEAHTNLANYYLSLALRSFWRAYRAATPQERTELSERLDKLLSTNPEEGESYFIRGGLFRLKGDAQQAREMYRMAAQHSPQFQPSALLDDARRLVQDGETDEALDNLFALSTLGEESLESELLVAEVMNKQKQYESALNHLEAYRSTGLTDFRYNLAMAAALNGSGQAAKAVPYLEKAVGQQDRPELRRQLAEAYKARGDFTHAVAEYEKLLKTEPDPTKVRQEIMELTRQKLQAAETSNGSHGQPGGAKAGTIRVPDSLLLMPINSRFALVEKETQTLLVFRSATSGFQLEKTFACSTGAKEGEKAEKGDEKTPEGVYLFRKILPGSQLPGIYGKLAITLDYPNAFDRLEGKSGDGIWVHATNETIRPYLPNKTRGCVVMSNDDIQEFAKLVRLNDTPLVIVPKIRYESQSERDADIASLKNFLSDWRQNWENKLIDPYISMYSSRFRNGNQDLKAFRKYKDSIFSRAGKIHLRTDLESIVRHDKYVVLTFNQEYRSQRLTSRGTKRLFLVREKGAWKIIAEVMKDTQ